MFDGVKVAYYLIHSMENKKDFVKSDLKAANNFAKLASKAGVQKIIYLGGLADENSSFGTYKEESRSCRILPDDTADFSFRIITVDAFPVLTSINGFIQIWTIVIEFVSSGRKV